MADVCLKLNDYQAANLRWLLACALDNKLPTARSVANGDWCAEIRWMLEQEMIEQDITQFPNDGEYYPKLMGVCAGMKRADYERMTRETQLERIRKVAALDGVEPKEKLRMIDELARGWVNVTTIKAIEVNGQDTANHP